MERLGKLAAQMNWTDEVGRADVSGTDEVCRADDWDGCIAASGDEHDEPTQSFISPPT